MVLSREYQTQSPVIDQKLTLAGSTACPILTKRFWDSDELAMYLFVGVETDDIPPPFILDPCLPCHSPSFFF